MEEQKINKLKTLIGFAIKSNKLKYGIDNISKKAHLVLVSEELSESSLDKLKNICEKNNISHKLLCKELFRKLFNEGIKAVSIEKSELSNAIYQLMEEN